MRRDTGRFLGFGVYANESGTAWAESLKVYINDDGDEVTVEPELAKPFDMMLEPIKTDISVINKSKMLGIDKFSETIENAIRHSKEFFESGGLPHAIQTYQNSSNFFEPKSSSKDFLVEQVSTWSNTRPPNLFRPLMPILYPQAECCQRSRAFCLH